MEELTIRLMISNYVLRKSESQKTFLVRTCQKRHLVLEFKPMALQSGKTSIQIVNLLL